MLPLKYSIAISYYIIKFTERKYVLAMKIFLRFCLTKAEALALTASNIDTVNRRISITKTYFRHKGKDEITEPKTRESVRTVIIPEFLAEKLKAYIESSLRYVKKELQ